jgi:hypothetical protein
MGDLLVANTLLPDGLPGRLVADDDMPLQPQVRG